MSPALLSQRLKDLENEGVIERRREGKGRRYTYHLTEAGQEFAPIIEAMGIWGRRWTRRELKPEEIDMDLLLWGLESTARFDAFRRVPTLIRIDLTDQPTNKRRWWFLNDDGRCQLCLHDPGHEIDLYLTSTTEDLIHVYLGDLPVSRALDNGRLEAIGSRNDIAHLPDWLNLSSLSKVASMREDFCLQ